MKNTSDNENKEVVEKDRITLKELVFDWTNTMFFFIAVVLIVMTFFFRQVTVDGPSMNDTLLDKDRLIVSSFLYTPQDGDIVIISHGENYDHPIVKRVIATAGQKLAINYETGEVKVDGVVIDEPYIKGFTCSVPNPADVPEIIPEGYVFVMGDNRENSADSRSKKIGLVPVQNIIGKAIFRIFPFDSFGSVK